MNLRSTFGKYGFFWVTLILFVGSLLGHWLFAWSAFQHEQIAHGEPIVVNEFFVEVLRDTLENWQSEFLQLMWQVAGLAYLFYLGSPQSKEGDERKEEKLDHIITMLDPKEGKETIAKLDRKYPKT